MFDFDKNKLLTAFAAVALLACTCMMNNKGVVEGFGPTKVVVAQPVYAQNAASAMKGQIFAAPPNFQAMLTPRCGISVGLPASITYNMPNSKNMATANSNHVDTNLFAIPHKITGEFGVVLTFPYKFSPWRMLYTMYEVM